MPLTLAPIGTPSVIRKITGKDDVRQHLAELQPRARVVPLGADVLFQRDTDHDGKVRAAVGADL